MVLMAAVSSPSTLRTCAVSAGAAARRVSASPAALRRARAARPREPAAWEQRPAKQARMQAKGQAGWQAAPLTFHSICSTSSSGSSTARASSASAGSASGASPDCAHAMRSAAAAISGITSRVTPAALLTVRSISSTASCTISSRMPRRAPWSSRLDTSAERCWMYSTPMFCSDRQCVDSNWCTPPIASSTVLDTWNSRTSSSWSGACPGRWEVVVWGVRCEGAAAGAAGVWRAAGGQMHRLEQAGAGLAGWRRAPRTLPASLSGKREESCALNMSLCSQRATCARGASSTPAYLGSATGLRRAGRRVSSRPAPSTRAPPAAALHLPAWPRAGALPAPRQAAPRAPEGRAPEGHHRRHRLLDHKVALLLAHVAGVGDDGQAGGQRLLAVLRQLLPAGREGRRAGAGGGGA
jgi:hypothetical protein